MTIYDLRQDLIKQLTPTSPSPQLDADCILQWVLDCDRTQLLLRRSDVLTEEQAAAIQAACEKRKTGFPIAYITGHKEFFGYDFYVTPDVLIPKPDTELLVELALAAIEDKQVAHPGRGITVCDMCTGSGCVGISITKNLSQKFLADFADGADIAEDISLSSNPAISMTLADISEKALDIARTNAKQLLSEHRVSESQCESETRALRRQANVPHSSLSFVQSNLFENIPHTFDLIATNPPYVPHTQARELLTDGRSEPLLALDGDVTETGDDSGTDDGLFLIRRLIPQVFAHLAANGVLLMETGEYNAEEAAGLCEQAGFRAVHIERDLSGQLRVVCGVK